MKRSLLLIVALLILGIAYYLLNSSGDGKTSIIIEDREFVLNEPDKVKTITITSTARPQIHLHKHKNAWLINDKYRANENIINSMLKTMKRMDIKYIPTVAENKTAKERMKRHGIEIVTYDEAGSVITEFILGTNTNDEYGTYCLKKGANQVYVMSIPIIEGGIRNYFTMDIPDLRDLTVLSYDLEEIKRVEVNYPKDTKNSFQLIRTEDGVDLIASGIEIPEKLRLNKNTVDAYLKDFNLLKAEKLNNEHMYRDSIEQLIPFMEITVTTKTKENQNYKIYSYLDVALSRINTRSVDDLSTRHEHYFVSTPEDDFFFVQDRFMRKFMQKVLYFY